MNSNSKNEKIKSGGKKFSKLKQGKKKQFSVEEKEQAEVLVHKNGIPFHYALQVVQGKKKMKEVLKELLKKNKVERMVKKHNIDRDLAGQIVAGNMTLEDAFEVMNDKKMKKQFGNTSCFSESFNKKESFVFQCHGYKTIEAVPLKNYKYDIDFPKTNSKEIIHLPKLEVKFAYSSKEKKKIEKYISIDEKIKKEKLPPIQKMVERFRIKNIFLRKEMLSKNKVKFITLEGEIIIGQIIFFNPYEINLDLGDSSYIYLLRHCLYRWESQKES